MSVILFLLVLFVLVLVHEWGHFIAAKKTGMRVDEFGIGFPPKVFGKKKGETEYTLNLFPIGGFVRIYGENPEDAGEGVVDSERAFHARPKWAQTVVLLAGVFMNVVFAWLLFTITFMVGVSTAVTEADATDAAKLYVVSTLPDSPAAETLPVGAVVTELSNGEDTIENPTPTSFSDFVTENAPNAVEVTYLQSGEKMTTTITPEVGLSETEPNKYLVGVSLSLVEKVQMPIHTAVVSGFNATINGLVAISTGLYGLVSDAIFGEADFSSVAGPVGIVGMVGDAAAFGVVALLTFTAIISLNLAVINLLPFPALDGGRLLFVAIEAVTRKTIPPSWTGRLNFIGFVLLITLMVAVTYNDIIRIL